MPDNASHQVESAVVTRASACAADCALGDALSRRGFMERSAIAVLGALLASCGDGIFGVRPAFAPGSIYNLTVSDYPALNTVGGLAAVTVASVPIAIGRTSATSYTIWSMSCPHQGVEVVISGAGFRCPGHDATWNNNGIWTGGQSTGALVVVPTTFDQASGVLTIHG